MRPSIPAFRSLLRSAAVTCSRGLRLTMTLALAAVVAACGDSTPLTESEGVFLDAAVDGLSYTGDRGSSGVTSAGGKFSYREGEIITFSVGGMVVGRVSGTDTVTPASLIGADQSLGDYAVRVLRVLQSLDSDGDPSNGITISADMRRAISGSLNLSTASDADALAAVQRARPSVSTLVSQDQALAHFAQTIVDRGIALRPPAIAQGSTVTFTLLHTNDTHSRMESFVDGISQGGVARRKTLVDQVRTEVGADKVLLVDAGDFAQGTVFYNAWEASESVMAMNAMGYDVATLGNHEFDLGPARLARALKGENITIAGTSYPTETPNFPIVATNLDIQREDALKGLLRKYTIIERAGQKFGILGVNTSDLPQIASLGDKAKVLDYVTSVNAGVSVLRGLGVDKIILLSHYGYKVDITLADKLEGVDIIVSAHDHVLLGEADYINSQTALASATFTAQAALSQGSYPTVLKNKDGDTLLVVAAYEWGRWLGRLDVTFDARGRVVTGVNKSLFVGSHVAEDAALAAKVAEYKAPVNAFSSVVVGSSAMLFSSARGAVGTSSFTVGVRTAETELGNLVTDLMQAAARRSDSAVAAFSNGGGLRADIPTGTVTFGGALSVLPFGNTLYVMDLTGQDVIDLMEASASKVGGGGFLQVSSAIRMTYCASADSCTNPLKPGGRVTSITIGDGAVSASGTYRLATNNFTAGGGDGYDVLKAACQRPGNYCRDTGIVLLDLLVDELKTGKPLSANVQGRITRLTPAP